MNQKNTSNNNVVIRGGGLSKDDMRHLVSENALIVFVRRGCCMTHVVKHLLQGLGVNPTVYKIDEQDENDFIGELQTIDAEVGKDDNRLQFPAVFIGGRLFGGLDRVMATHITGE